jgi:uncharacterized iron-regulated protein
MSAMNSLVLGALLLSLAVLSPARAARPEDRWRVVETATGKTVRWRDLAGRLAKRDAVFVGEQHDDPQTHRVEAALLEALHAAVGPRLTLAMEMFERDNQAALDDYLAGRTDESGFAKAARLWKNYPTDYRPLIEYARAQKIPTLASNAPQAIVRRVGREGLVALSTLAAPEKSWAAAYVVAPDNDAYAQRFAAVMGGDGGAHGGAMDAAQVRRIYEAQCLRDDTMGETVANALAAGRFVVHINGSFHSDAGLGTAARVRWRRPLTTQLAIVKVVPVAGDVRGADIALLRAEADYLIFVPDERPTPAR